VRARATTDTAKLTRTADALFQEIVCHENECAYCGAPGVAGHHLVGRAHKGVRWSIINGLPLCTLCHNDVHSGHLDILDWLRVTDPARFWFVMSHQNAQPVQVKAFHIRETIEQLKAIKKSLDTIGSI